MEFESKGFQYRTIKRVGDIFYASKIIGGKAARGRPNKFTAAQLRELGLDVPDTAPEMTLEAPVGEVETESSVSPAEAVLGPLDVVLGPFLTEDTLETPVTENTEPENIPLE